MPMHSRTAPSNKHSVVGLRHEINADVALIIYTLY